MASKSTLVHIGCGFTVGPSWVNYDASPTARIENIPLVGRLLSRLVGNENPFPRGVRYGDIVKGLPVASGSVAGIFASHVFEHLSLEDFRKALRECMRILQDGGTLGLIVPDLLSRAREYVQTSPHSSIAAHAFMRSCYLGSEQPLRGAIGRIRGLLGNSSHLWMWDESSMRAELEAAGFTHIRRAHFGDSVISECREVEELGRFAHGLIRKSRSNAASLTQRQRRNITA